MAIRLGVWIIKYRTDGTFNEQIIANCEIENLPVETLKEILKFELNEICDEAIDHYLESENSNGSQPEQTVRPPRVE